MAANKKEGKKLELPKSNEEKQKALESAIAQM